MTLRIYQIFFCRGSAPDPAGRAHHVPPDPFPILYPVDAYRQRLILGAFGASP